MIRSYHPVIQAVLGTLFTWALTAAGAALVFFFSSTKRKVLDASLGFAAGVMIAASYWSLLSPAIELAEKSGSFGQGGEFAFLPAVVGFVLGAVFIYAADIALPHMGFGSPIIALAVQSQPKQEKDNLLYSAAALDDSMHPEVAIVGLNERDPDGELGTLMQRRRHIRDKRNYQEKGTVAEDPAVANEEVIRRDSWRRILLLLVAVTVHNVPEGLAVGVGFGAIAKTESATFESARNLALGIGIQNFPEGLAVSLPLKGAGFSLWQSFWYGQLSGMVEPIAGLLGALLISVSEPILPYALAFAAGAMIYVVVDDIIPEAHSCGNGRLSSWGAVIGFSVMMALDVGLG